MLTKDFQRTLVPGVESTPEVPYRAQFTVCQQEPAPGHWEKKCSRIEIPVNGGVLIPPGGEIVVVRHPNGAIDPVTGEVKVVDMYIRVCTTAWVVDGPPGATYCTTYPEQQYVPAVSGRPARVETSVLLGWNAGANSVASHDGDCVCSFDMDHPTGAMCGFTADLEDVSLPARLTHALYFHGGKFQVVESGKAKTPDTNYARGDQFKIQRASGEVTYLHGSRRVYTSRVASVGAIHVGAALYASSDAIGAYSAAPEPAGAGAVIYYGGDDGSFEASFIAADVGLQVPDFADPVVVNLLDLPGASYQLETENSCGGAAAYSLGDGVLATIGTLETGMCAESAKQLVLTIQGAAFPFPALAESLYGGRLLVTYGHGISSGISALIYLNIEDDTEVLGDTRYYSMTPADVDSNSGNVSDRKSIGKMSAAFEGAGLRVVANVLKTSSAINGTFEFSTNLALTIPPPQPERFYAILEEHWPVGEFEGVGEMEFPLTPSTADGVTTIAVRCMASDPLWWNPTPVINYEEMQLSVEELDAVFDETRGYKVGVYSGDDGYVNMKRVGTIKLMPGGSGGGDE